MSHSRLYLHHSSSLEAIAVHKCDATLINLWWDCVWVSLWRVTVAQLCTRYKYTWKKLGHACTTRCTCSHTKWGNRAWSNLLCALPRRMFYCFPHGSFPPPTFVFFFFFYISFLTDRMLLVQMSCLLGELSLISRCWSVDRFFCTD